MPTGADGFRKKKEAAASRQAAFGGNAPKVDYFGLTDGQMAVVRFLEQGSENLHYADYHRIPVAGRQWPVDYVCLDTKDEGTPCPACASEHKGISSRSTKGVVNLIWRGGLPTQQWLQQLTMQRASQGQPPPNVVLGPVWKRNEYQGAEKDSRTGKPIVLGYADGVFVWKCSGTVFAELLNKDETFRGLMSRDFVIRRQGAAKDDTAYFIEPFDVDGGAQPMLIPDQVLAEKKYDLRALTTPISYADMAAALGGQPVPNGPQPTMDRSALVTAENVFAGGPPLRSSAFSRG